MAALHSVLDNKETFQQFSKPDTFTKFHKNSFISATYRHQNLRLANVLDRCDGRELDSVDKTVRRIRFCNSQVILEVDKDNSASFLKGSKSCKSPSCAMCQRARAAKISKRFQKALTDLEISSRFVGRHFYFLTLTLRHDDNTRNTVYLKELNKNCLQLFRSKLFNTHFPKKSKNGQGGYIYSRECTFGDNGYHIHSHVLICSDRLKCSVSLLEKEIRAKWLKITGDSDQVRLDLVRDLSAAFNGSPEALSSSVIHKTVAELIKYGTKIGTAKRLNKAVGEMLCNWIDATKGQNLVNVTGIFRGLKLTGSKSPWDSKAPDFVPNPNHKYFAARTSQIVFSHSPISEYNKLKNNNDLNQVYIKGFLNEGFEITEFVTEFQDYLKYGFDDKDISDNIKHWVKWAEDDKKKSMEDWSSRMELEAQEAAKYKQLELDIFAKCKVEHNGFIDGW